MTNYILARLQGIGYKDAIQSVYDKKPSLKTECYQVQLEAFLAEKLSHAGGLIEAMSKLGNQCHELFYDCRIMQETWARERGIKFDEATWQTDILLEQLREISPDVVLFQDIFSMPAELRSRVKELVSSIRVTVLQKGYPGEMRDLGGTDILLVSSPVLYERYTELNPYLVYHPFDRGVLNCIHGDTEEPHEQHISFSFLGNCRAPERRYWMLRELLDRTNIEIWGMEEKGKYAGQKRIWNKKRMKKALRAPVMSYLQRLSDGQFPAYSKSRYIPRKLRNMILEIENLENDKLRQTKLAGLSMGKRAGKTLKEMYPQRCHDPVFGVDYYKILKRSRIVFNLHSDAAGDTVDNMKLFEITGVGSCLLTDTGKNMNDLFTEDEEIVTYKSLEEAVEKYVYLNEHTEIREEIARKGQQRTLRDHTVEKRCQQIDDIVRSVL